MAPERNGEREASVAAWRCNGRSPLPDADADASVASGAACEDGQPRGAELAPEDQSYARNGQLMSCGA
jgi:hypothetical protein